VSIVSQYTALAIGLSWGWVSARRISGLDALLSANWFLFAEIGIGALLVEGCRRLPYFSVRKTASEDACLRRGLYVSLLVVLYTLVLMYTEPFLFSYDSIEDVLKLALLAPFLVSISLLTWLRAWFGVAGCVILFATCLAMLIDNACRLSGANGFFYAIVY